MSSWSSDRPYNTLPPLPPRADLESRQVLKLAIAARDALARLDASSVALPNPTVLINAIPLLEAQASSEIENIVTTTDELFASAVVNTPTGPAAREALRYRTALRQGFDQIAQRPLTMSIVTRVCEVIQGREMPVRTGPVIIGSPVTRVAVYTPPDDPVTIRSLLTNWERFVNGSDDLDPLVRMAVAHYQLEAIHPFTDGNGRTGRVANVLMLCQAGLLSLPVLYLSRHFIATKSEYYQRLLAVTSDDDWQGWVAYVLEGVRSTAMSTLTLIRRLRNHEQELVGQIRSVLGSVDHDLHHVLMEQPYSRVRDVMERSGISRPTATKRLKELAEAGVLTEWRLGREVLYVNRAFMEILVAS
jgi:Fic family protein